MLTIFAVSDATGETAERMVRSAIVQFERADVQVIRHAEICHPDQVRAVVQQAAAGGALIVHTLVSESLRRLMLAESRLHAVDAMDILGPLLDRLARHLHLSPQEKPGLLRQVAEAKTREIEAIAFAFRHDDGQNVGELSRAEVVLLGVSRSMKTPTTLYLAYRGWFAANVPLVPDLPLPDALLTIPPRRVFYLSIQPETLRERRRARAVNEAIPLRPYASLAQIHKELRYADRLCQQHGWRRVDITGRAVEEVAREISALLAEEEESTVTN
jgi:[pyruvate, water dikinase]-phosphate phosphotransferase / [pyruvate, water dikinase] kinase